MAGREGREEPAGEAWPCPARHPALKPRTVHVWRARLDLAHAALARLEALLEPDERERAARFRIEADRRRFTAARAVLRLLCGRYLGRAAGQVRFMVPAGHGKPRLADSPPEIDLRFNVSHSGGLALYAFALGAEVGVDVEALRADFSPRQIEESFLPAREVERLVALPADVQQRAYLETWTRREALAKATGEGLAPYLEKAGGPSAGPGEWRLVALEPGEGYVAALAMPRGRWRIERWEERGAPCSE